MYKKASPFGVARLQWSLFSNDRAGRRDKLSAKPTDEG